MTERLLYKYRSWNSPVGRRFLQDEELYFASADSFNDPLEARIPLRYDLATDEQIRDLFLRHAPDEYPDKTPEEHRLLADQYLKQGLFKNPSHIDWFENWHYEKNIRDFGICSLTAVGSSILMWAHYADSHHGYCVGLDVDLLEKFMETNPDALRVTFDIYEVEYIKKFPVLKPFEMSREELITRPLTIKSKQWEYEQEYRLISLENTSLTLKMSPEIISRVVLGCRMPDIQRREVIECLKDKSYKVDLWEAKISKEIFGLYFENINY